MVDWTPEDDAAIDRLMARIDNSLMTRADWDAIEDELARHRKAATAKIRAVLQTHTENAAKAMAEYAENMADLRAELAAKNAEIEKLRSLLGTARESLNDASAAVTSDEWRKDIQRLVANIDTTLEAGEAP